jgi:hypothetical protein
MGFVKHQPFGGDVFRKLAVMDLSPGLFLKFDNAFHSQQAHLPVPFPGVGIAYDTCFIQADGVDGFLYRAFLFGDVYR